MAKAAEFRWEKAGEDHFYFQVSDGRVAGSVSPTNHQPTGKAVVYGAYLESGEMLGYYVGADAAQRAVALGVTNASAKLRAPKRTGK